MVNVSQNNNNQVQRFFAKLDDQHKNADTSTIDKKDTAVKSVFDQAKAETNAKIANIDVGDNENLKNKLTSKLGNVKNIINNQYLNSLNSINETYSTDSQESADAADAGFNAKKDAEIGNINNTIESLLQSMKAEAEAELKQEEAAKQLKEGETAESTPTEEAKKETTVYAEYGESFDATAKRLGFEKGTDEYNKFLAANSEAAGRSKGGWFKVGEDVKIPDDIKEKANKEQIDEQRNNEIKQQSVQQYKDVQAEKARIAAQAKKARMEEHGLKDEANRGKKMTFTVNGKQETYVVQGTSKDRGRILVKGKDGYHYVSHDGKLLKDAYSASTTTNVKNGKVKLGRETYTVTKDSAGRTIASDSSGKMVAAQSADGKNLKLGYVQNKQKMESSGAANKMQALKSAYQNAQNSFDAQMKKDGWAADVADGISHVWNNDLINLTGNTASQVRAELAEFKNKLSQMEAAYKKGDIKTFNRLQSELSSKNIQKRVANYNQSQDTGAEVVKTTAKVGAAVAVGVATGGTGLVALGTAAAVTTAASVVIDETDRMNITGSYTDANGNKVETEGTFREGTDHMQILKNAAWDGVGVLAGGVVGKGAQMLSKGSKYMKAGLSMTGDVATGAVQEKLQTGEVTVAGTLMNAAGSAVGSAAELGYFKKVKDSLGAKFKKVNVDTPTETPAPKQHPTMDPPKYVVPENESVLAKATRNGNDPSAVAPPRSVGKLNDEKFAQVKAEVQERLAKIDVADSQDLELLQKQVDALQDRSQRHELDAMIKAKKAELNAPKSEPIATPVTEKPDPSSISTPESTPTPVTNPVKKSISEVVEKLPQHLKHVFNEICDEIESAVSLVACSNIKAKIVTQFGHATEAMKALLERLNEKINSIKLNMQKVDEIAVQPHNQSELHINNDFKPVQFKDLGYEQLSTVHGSMHLNRGQKYQINLAENQNAQISMGFGVTNLDVTDSLFLEKFKQLKEGEFFTVGSWEGNADYKIGSMQTGVSREHFTVMKENGQMVIIDKKSTNGTKLQSNNPRPLSINEIRTQFSNDRISSQLSDVNPKIVKKMGLQLDAVDYQNIQKLMNVCDGKYINVWLGTCGTDDLQNIQKLAMLEKVLRKNGAIDDYLKMGSNEWDLVCNTTCQKYQQAVSAIGDYKNNSNPMNMWLSAQNSPDAMLKFNEKWSHLDKNMLNQSINQLEAFLDTQTINKKVWLHRGDSYNGLNFITSANGNPLGTEMERLIAKGASEAEIKEFVANNLQGRSIYQERFMSTTLTKDIATGWAKKDPCGKGYNPNGAVRWDISAAAGTKGAHVEDFTPYKMKENEVLLQRGTSLDIIDAYFEPNENIWVIEARAVQR